MKLHSHCKHGSDSTVLTLTFSDFTSSETYTGRQIFILHQCWLCWRSYQNVSI